MVGVLWEGGWSWHHDLWKSRTKLRPKGDVVHKRGEVGINREPGRIAERFEIRQTELRSIRRKKVVSMARCMLWKGDTQDSPTETS